MEIKSMYYLYGLKPAQNPTLVATFDSEQQLLAYVGWATLHENPDHTYKFEQGSALASCNGFESSQEPLYEGNPDDVPHNPSPSML